MQTNLSLFVEGKEANKTASKEKCVKNLNKQNANQKSHVYLFLYLTKGINGNF